MSNLVYIFGSLLLVSAVSFVGLLTLSWQVNKVQKALFFLISLAAGTLLGDVFFHIFPEIVDGYGFNIQVGAYVVGAMIIFFILERFIRWHHYHHISEEENHAVGVLNLAGDGLHNFIDGMIIAAAYLTDTSLGVATTIAVLLHELPQEIGDFAILIHSGFTRGKALLFNFLSALLALVGGLLVWWGNNISSLTMPLLALTAGGFIYIATVDLIPELHKEARASQSLVQLFGFIVGIGLMVALLFIEK